MKHQTLSTRVLVNFTSGNVFCIYQVCTADGMSCLPFLPVNSKRLSKVKEDLRGSVPGGQLVIWTG